MSVPLVRVVAFDSRSDVDFRFISASDFFMKMRKVRETIPDVFLEMLAWILAAGRMQIKTLTL